MHAPLLMQVEIRPGVFHTVDIAQPSSRQPQQQQQPPPVHGAPSRPGSAPLARPAGAPPKQGRVQSAALHRLPRAPYQVIAGLSDQSTNRDDGSRWMMKKNVIFTTPSRLSPANLLNAHLGFVGRLFVFSHSAIASILHACLMHLLLCRWTRWN